MCTFEAGKIHIETGQSTFVREVGGVSERSLLSSITLPSALLPLSCSSVSYLAWAEGSRSFRTMVSLPPGLATP